MRNALRKLSNLQQAQLYLLRKGPAGGTVTKMAEALGIDRATAWRYVQELNTEQVGAGKYTRWRYLVTNDDVEFAHLVLEQAGYQVID
jgi:DNA-binding IclR family transcriptional regulator